MQDETECPRALWGDGCVDLTDCCAQTCTDPEQAVFRLKAFVHYCRKPPEPRRLVSSGHFVAYFQEQGIWYMSDDLKAAGRAVALDNVPEVYPYLCFFERLGRPAVVPPALSPNPMVLGADLSAQEEASTGCRHRTLDQRDAHGMMLGSS